MIDTDDRINHFVFRVSAKIRVTLGEVEHLLTQAKRFPQTTWRVGAIALASAWRKQFGEKAVNDDIVDVEVTMYELKLAQKILELPGSDGWFRNELAKVQERMSREMIHEKEKGAHANSNHITGGVGGVVSPDWSPGANAV